MSVVYIIRQLHILLSLGRIQFHFNRLLLRRIFKGINSPCSPYNDNQITSKCMFPTYSYIHSMHSPFSTSDTSTLPHVTSFRACGIPASRSSFSFFSSWGLRPGIKSTKSLSSFVNDFKPPKVDPSTYSSIGQAFVPFDSKKKWKGALFDRETRFG